MRGRLLEFVTIASLIVIAGTVLFSGTTSADIVQLKNDNDQAEGYITTARVGYVMASVLTPGSTQYPVEIQSVDFLLYRFSGAADSAQVRVKVYSLAANGRPGTLLGASDPITVTTFYPNWVSVNLSSLGIVISSPNSFVAAVEYLSGQQGSIPSTLMDSNDNIPQGRNFYSRDGGTNWIEHYDFWVEPATVGYNMVRATVNTNVSGPTSTPTFTGTPTSSPTPTATGTPTATPTPIPGSVALGSPIGYGKQHSLVRDSSGKVHLLYLSGDANQAFHLWSTDNGQTWLPPTPELVYSGTSLEGSVAIDSADNLHLVLGKWDGGDALYTRYDGLSWSTPITIGVWAFGRNIAVDRNDVLHVLWSNADTMYTRFDGSSWSGPDTIASGAWHPAIAIDRDNGLHVVYNDNNYYPASWVEARYISSPDGGLSWTAPLNLSNDNLWSGSAAIVIDSQGRPHVTYIAASPVVEGGLYYLFRDNGIWSPPEIISSGNAGVQTGSTGKESASMAMDAADNLYVLSKVLNPARLWDIVLRVKDSCGWKPPMNLTNNLHVNSTQQSIAYGLVTEAGLDLVWQTGNNVVYHHIPLEQLGLCPTPSPTPTPTLTPGDNYVRVVDENGQPVNGARVYLNGSLVTDANGHPALTANGGVLNFDHFDPGDELVALALQYQQPTVRGAHDGDPDPRYPGQNWAFRVYLTSFDVAPDGSPVPYVVPSPGSGEQRLVVKKSRPLVAYNVVVSLEWDAPTTYVQQISQAFKLASDYLFDVTDGQMAFANVWVYDNAAHWRDADFQIAAKNVVRPYAYVGGLFSSDPSHCIRVGRLWDGQSGNNGPWDQPEGYRTLIHEFGHYALGLYDEYFYYLYDAEGHLIGTADSDCISPEIVTNALYAINASIMDYQYNASELAMIGTAQWGQCCLNTVQWQMNGESDWETVTRLYRDPGGQNRWSFLTPRDRGIVSGPDSGPLAQFPLVDVSGTISSTASVKELYVDGPNDSHIGAVVTLYTTQDGHPVAIDQGFTDQNGQIAIYGATQGDTVRVASWDGAFAGSVTIDDRQEYYLVLGASGLGLKAVGGPALNPYINVIPGSDGRTLYLRVYGIPAGGNLQATVTQSGNPTPETADLAYSSTIGAYIGTIVFDIAQLGSGNIHVSGADSQGQPVDMSCSYALLRLSPFGDSVLFSSDGDVELYVPAGSVPADTYAVIVPLNAPPTSPEVPFTLVGSAYDIRFSGSLVELAQPGALKMHYHAGLRGTETPGALLLRRWNPTTGAWDDLYGKLSTRDQSLSKAVTRSGTYGIMASGEQGYEKIYLPLIMHEAGAP